jgi:putative glutamine amidotransferase
VVPLIALTCDRRAAGPVPTASSRARPPRPEVFVSEALVEAIREAGGEPVLLPPGGAALAGRIVLACAGVVISGGAFDVHPRHYGQAVAARLDRVDEDRTALELALARACLERGLPVLGVCGGMQALVVAAGGTLVQDIASAVPGALEHEQPTDPATPWHDVTLGPGALREAFGRDVVAVNSTHHQAVADPGPFAVAGRSSDGVVEAVELPGHPFAAGVQWHPEILDRAPFAALLAAVRAPPRASGVSRFDLPGRGRPR